MKSAIEWYKNTRKGPRRAGSMFVTIHPQGCFYFNAELMKAMSFPKFVKVGFDCSEGTALVTSSDERDPDAFLVKTYKNSAGGYIHSKPLLDWLPVDSGWTAPKVRCPVYKTDNDVYAIEMPEEG